MVEKWERMQRRRSGGIGREEVLLIEIRKKEKKNMVVMEYSFSTN